jgi:RecA/RadA recombinase
MSFEPCSKIQIQGSSFATGLELQERRKRVLTISTGSKVVDAMLGGKFHNGKLKVHSVNLAFTGGLISQSITEGKST